MSAEGEELLDVAAKAIYDERQRQSFRTGLPYHAIGEITRRFYRKEALNALRAAACWMDEHNWDNAFEFKRALKELVP